MKNYRGWTLTFERNRYTAIKGQVSISASNRVGIERAVDAFEGPNGPGLPVVEIETDLALEAMKRMQNTPARWPDKPDAPEGTHLQPP